MIYACRADSFCLFFFACVAKMLQRGGRWMATDEKQMRGRIQMSWFGPPMGADGPQLFPCLILRARKRWGDLSPTNVAPFISLPAKEASLIRPLFFILSMNEWLLKKHQNLPPPPPKLIYYQVDGEISIQAVEWITWLLKINWVFYWFNSHRCCSVQQPKCFESRNDSSSSSSSSSSNRISSSSSSRSSSRTSSRHRIRSSSCSSSRSSSSSSRVAAVIELVVAAVVVVAQN